MTTTIPQLPVEVLDAIKAAEEAIRAEQTSVITEVEARRIDRVGTVAARRNGEDTYMSGHRAIMASVFGGQPLPASAATVAPTVATSVRTCECQHCDVTDCQADCDECDDEECAQCHTECQSQSSCCAWCSECDAHHDDIDGNSENRYQIRMGSGRGQYEDVCTDCEHVCTQV